MSERRTALTAQPSTDLSFLNRVVSHAYAPAQVRVPALSLERTHGSLPNRMTTQGPAAPEEWTLFTRISPQGRQEIVRTARKCEFRRCHTIHIEGDPVQQVVLLLSGCAKLVQIGQNGTEVILGHSDWLRAASIVQRHRQFGRARRSPGTREHSISFRSDFQS
jgi:hypothetical protein